jgi:serine/threonine protein phosphatase PrpC
LVKDLIDHAGISEQGPVRKRNEDYIGHGPADGTAPGHHKGNLFIVCDGVGGSGAGDVASKAVTETVIERYYAAKKRPEKALLDAISMANLHVYDISMKADRLRMETTIAALAIVGHKAVIANIGDTRAYRIRNNSEIELLSTDHSEVAEMVKMRILTPENARHHPRRHIITRSMGSNPMIAPAVRIEPIHSGDTFVLCTDGLWEPVNDEEIADIATSMSPREACQALIDLGIKRGTNDNVSVQVVTVNAIDHETAKHHPVELTLLAKIAAIFGGSGGKK